MDLDFSLLTFSPSTVKKNSKSSTNKKSSKLAKSRRIISSINNGPITKEKEWTTTNVYRKNEITKSDLTSKCNVDPFISISEKPFNRRVNKGKENRFNKCTDLASDQQDSALLLKTVSKVRPWLSTEFSPEIVSAKKKRLMEKDLPKQTPSFLERLKVGKSNSPRKKTPDNRTNFQNNDNVVTDSVIVISDSGSDASAIINSSKTNFKSPWSGNLKKKNVFHKEVTVVLESSDSESEIIYKTPPSLHTPMTPFQKHTSHKTDQICFPVNSTPLLPSEALSCQSKYKDVESWLSKIPSLTNLEQTSDTHDLSSNRVEENITDNVWSTSTEDLLKNLYGSSLQPSVLNLKTPRTEPLKKKSPKLIQYTCVNKKQIQDNSSNSTKSEDFENFLKSVRRNFESTNQSHRSGNGSVGFINDEDENENDGTTFYHTAFNKFRNNDSKKDKSSSDSSTNFSKKNCIDINRKLIFSSSDGDIADKKKSSSDDNESKFKIRKKKHVESSDSKNTSSSDSGSDIKNRRKKNINSSNNKKTSSSDSGSDIKNRRKKNINSSNNKKTSSDENKPKLKTRKKKNINSSNSKKSSSNDELEIKTTKKKTYKKRIPKVISSPVKRIIRTAPKLTHKNPKRSSLQSSVCSLQPSFLASLSSNSIGNNHSEGLYYKNNFRRKKEELCRKLFKMYNDQVFGNKLPESLLVEWNVRMKKTAGFCYNRRTLQSPGTKVRTSRIVLSTKVCDTAERLRDTLIHELCHAATWIVDNVKDGHGPHWKSWARRAMNTFPELPPIKRCHDYKIQTKFTYRCTRCGYSIGRHSKSLDIATKRCGLCFGMFELLVNARRNSGTVVQTSVKKRSPVGFARYVKENYNSVKISQTNMKHADVMRLLGQQFSAVKIGARKLD